MPLRDKIYLKYKTKHKNNEKTHYILLPKFIRIDENFIRCIGLLDAEKTKFRTKKSTLEFVNSEPLIINEILTFFKIFYVHKGYWKWKLIFNGNIKHLIKDKIKDIANFWIENTGLSNSKQADSSPYFTKPKGAYKIKTKKGSLSLNYNSLFLHNFIESLSRKIKLVIINNEIFIWAYLSGFLSGEAYVGDRRCRQIHTAFQEKKQLNFIRNLLNRVGIKTSYAKACSTSPPRILICGKNNFLELYKKGIFDINLKKKASLIRRLLSYKGLDSKIRHILEKDKKLLNNLLKERELI